MFFCNLKGSINRKSDTTIWRWNILNCDNYASNLSILVLFDYSKILKAQIITIVVFNLFHYLIKSLLLEMKRVFKHQDLQIFGLK